jgi:glycosyltransferase involved in cell wall biosynthesis
MRVLMTVSSTSLMDGINRHVLAFAPKLNAIAGLEVAVVTLHPRGELNTALEAQGVRTFSMSAPNGHVFAVVWRFKRLMDEFRPNIVHIHVIAFWESVIAKYVFPKTKYVVTIHGVSDPPTCISLKQGLERIFNGLTDLPVSTRIFVSHGVMKAAGEGVIPSRVLYNAIDFNHRPAGGKLRGELGVSGDVLLVGTACRIAAVKNPQAFTRVMCKILRVCTDAHAVVIGAGDESIEEEIRRIALNSGVAARMHFLGFRADARDLIADMDLFVLTSQREGLPTALLEAMASKVPVAFWDGEGGLGDLKAFHEAEGPVAVVVKQGDEAALVNGMYELISDSERAKAYAERAFAVGLRHFDINYVASELVAVYSDLLG